MKFLKTIRTLVATGCLVLAPCLAHAIDISFQEGVSPTAGYTTGAVTVRSNVPATNQNGSPQIIVGENSSHELRGILEFDLSEIETQAGANPFIIDSVSLWMVALGTNNMQNTGLPNTGIDSIDLRVLLLNEDFDESTATWNSLTPDGGDTTATELSALTFDPSTMSDTLRTFGTTAAFESAAVNALSNDNFLRLLLFRPDDKPGNAQQVFARFFSDEQANTSFRPELRVSFTIPEPSTLLLLGSGLAGLFFFRRPKKAAR